MAITFTSKTAKIVGIIAAVLALLLLGLKFFDDDKTNDPKLQEVIDAGKGVYDAATGDVITAPAPDTTTAAAQ